MNQGHRSPAAAVVGRDVPSVRIACRQRGVTRPSAPYRTPRKGLRARRWAREAQPLSPCSAYGDSALVLIPDGGGVSGASDTVRLPAVAPPQGGSAMGEHGSAPLTLLTPDLRG